MKAVYKSSCCRRSLLYGACSAKAVTYEQKLVTFNVDKLETADFLSHTIKEFFGKEATITAPQTGGRCKSISFESKAMSSYLSSFKTAEDMFSLKCPYCQSAFIRGIFLVSGRMSDPNKTFCLEFSLGNRVDIFFDYFSELGIEMKQTTRKSENLLYTKNSTVIEDFLALAELNDAAFDLMNVKIANDLKNEANRIRNFDTVNISKAVDAANHQYTVIKLLYDKKILNQLPEELISTAKMRLENPDMSLSQLAMHSVPPLTKSGISHRMTKIVKLAEELLKKHG